ncbi:MAG: cyclase family protein [Myxococcota bacterium]
MSPLLATVVLDGERVQVDLAGGIDAGHGVRFGRSEVGAFSLPAARREPVTLGSFVGSVARGGSVNCEELVLFPHGNGTHTECIGHILHDARPVSSLTPPGLIPARVVSARPMPLEQSGERYGGNHRSDDLVISAKALAPVLGQRGLLSGWALVVRSGVGIRDHSGSNPPYFTDDAMQLIDDSGTSHLLTDLPSLDRENDGGSLSAHRIFWGVQAHSAVSTGEKGQRTVTELCRLDELAEGRYLLSLQIAPLESDAAPSRPLFFPVLPT